MKNQYFGDVNDYLKYGLLRGLASSDLSVVVCWMLTPNDGRADGGRIQYLNEPKAWRSFDPELFESLSSALKNGGTRNVELVERKGLIPSARYHSAVLHDALPQRENYFNDLSRIAKDRHIIFLDEDNGMEVKSVKKGRKRSSKYLYWDEAKRFYEAGHSLLIYQHFRRIERGQFIRDMTKEMRLITGAPCVLPMVTKHVVFFLVPQVSQKNELQALSAKICDKWHPHIWDGLVP